MAAINAKAYLLLIARLVLSAVFLLAAFPKIQDPVAFTASIEGFRVVGNNAATWIALGLPWLELVTGLGLLIPQIRRASAMIIALLLITFIALHASAWIRDLDINCGCFGVNEAHEAPNYLWLILRNVALLGACLCTLIRDWRNPRPPAVTDEVSTS
ncbi:MauE/DoxX family redox-associated membrane protein [Coraliomargarita sp. SDUM461003]|uniref:MauE/DoxX family redox-associated membrane protein n=1 Tax=Thalassobacterium maritimum TaxID=3041265 RepID=A0ABU1AWG6_9BACT|nr:MauE/DoxX family redox-associated membrane protein [Coraliomargarita sp. SDUM461003]MDQ8208499.1 MauE/DoxX family redox-associated membrane protein [Coraliomargarita sp. SDUM461003]